MSKGPPPPDHDDNPEWTDEDFAQAVPPEQLHPPHVVAALIRRPPGRPMAFNKEQVALRIDNDVLAAFRADGPGWQTRMNAALRKAVGL